MDPFLLGGHIYGALYSSYKWSIRNDFGHSAQHCWAFEKHAVDLCYSLLTSICTYVWSRMSYVCSSVNVICLFVCSCVCLCMSVSIGLVSKLQTSFLQLSFYYVSLPFPFSPPVFSGPGTPPFVSAYCLSFERALMWWCSATLCDYSE